MIKSNVLINVSWLLGTVYLMFEHIYFIVMMEGLDVWWKTGTDSMLKSGPHI